MTALFDVTLGAAESPDEKIAQPHFRAREVAGRIHDPKDIIARHLRIEGPHQPGETVFANLRVHIGFVDRRHEGSS